MSARFDALFTGLFFHGRFFTGGWGELAALREQFGLPATCERWDDPAALSAFRQAMLPARTPADIDIAWLGERRWPGGTSIRRGTFTTPYNAALLPEASRLAHVEQVCPAGPAPGRPACVLFAATGEQGFLSRRLLALALARHGITTLILENPYYGLRRPADQRGYFQNRFVDLLAMFNASIEEGRALLAWLRRSGHERLAVSGISMGGSVSALVAARSTFPVAAISLIPSSSVGPAYAGGVIANHVAWERLADGLPPGVDPRRLIVDWLSVFDVCALPRPVAESACCFLSATDDGCIPRHATDALHCHWPAARIEWIEGGHTTGAVFGWNRYRRAIIAALSAVPPVAPGGIRTASARPVCERPG